MERGTTKQDYDEFEMLLGEIPSATSENPHSGEANRSDPSPEHDQSSFSISKFTNLYNSSRVVKNGGNMVFYGDSTILKVSSDQKLQCNGKPDNAINAYKTLASNVKQDEQNFMDTHSLTLALEGLSFEDGLATKPSTTVSVKYNKTSPYCTILQNGEYPDHPTDSVLGVNTIGMSSPSVTTINGVRFMIPELESSPPFTITNGVNKLSGKVDGDQLKNQKAEKLLGNFADEWQSYPVCSRAMPVSPAMQAYQMVPTIPVPKMDVKASSYQQPKYLNAQSPPYMSHQLSHSGMELRNMEEERFCGINHQYYYPQQLQNQAPTVRQIPISANIHIRPLSACTVQPYFEMPISCQIKQGSQNSYWNDNDIRRGYNHLNSSTFVGGLSQYSSQGSCAKGKKCGTPPHQKLTFAGSLTCSANDFMEHQVLDKVGKQYFPEKILTRSHGVNSLRSLGPDTIRTNQSQLFADNSAKIISIGHTHHPLVHTNGFFHLDDRNHQNSPPEIFDLHSSKSIGMEYNSVDEVVGRILSMAKDQHGCRFLQRIFTEGTPEDVGKIFIEIVGHIVELMTDPFANYLVQKLLEVCNEDQRMCILHAITREAGKLIRISCDMHGTRSVQKVIETLQTKEHFTMIVSSLKPGVVTLIKDINGNHVAQRCLQYFSPEYNEFLFDAAVAHCVELATDRQGCCVLQKCMHHADGDQKHKLMSMVASNSLTLSQDPYGNYVVQYVLNQKVPWVTAVVLDQLEGKYEYLSMQKYSSNVVEKCLKLAGEDRRVKIIKELKNNPRLVQILQDPYGNYVIQSALNQCKGAIHAALVEAIRPHVPILRCSPYGKKILSSSSLKNIANMCRVRKKAGRNPGHLVIHNTATTAPC